MAIALAQWNRRRKPIQSAYAQRCGLGQVIKDELMTQPQTTASQPQADPVAFRKQLEQQFNECNLIRPFSRGCYEAGDELNYEVTGVVPAKTGRVLLRIEKFVGGGFAGQVYRVKLQGLDGDIVGLVPGQTYAVKILKPPSAFACAFRDFLFMIGYQGRFSAQVNPHAVRVGVLWQKLIRRAAATAFNDNNAVCDTFATFYDAEMHSFGEINEWITGRVWKFEVDDDLFNRWNFKAEPPADHNCPEYVHKKIFMDKLVNLLHEMGAPELARQYEWWSCKSQPNALKRTSAADDPAAGLTAVDFRAGLALLPFAPMSPVDFRLILRGLFTGRIVQFDRSDPQKFDEFIEERSEQFADLQPAIDELKEHEPLHRSSLPDITRNHVKLLTNTKTRQAAKVGTITSWLNLGRVDEAHAERLRGSWFMFYILFTLSFVPILGSLFIKLWGDPVTKRHLGTCLVSGSYLWRTMKGTRIEALIAWHRQGRGCDERLAGLVDRPVRFWAQRIPLGILPPSWHRFVIEPAYAKARIRDTLSFTWKFLRNPPFREAWLLEQVEMGRNEGMLSDEEAAKISEQVKDPFIQKYLRCLAVHICTVPITQVVMVIVGAAVTGYCLTYKGMSWVESLAAGSAAGAVIQISPISPGSLARGFFVLYMMIRERDIRNYYIAAPVSFLHVIGYLAFPLQMVKHDPALARFMAGRWAKNAVHFVPVFGESGGLLEHAVFDVFFNLPLSIKRGFKTRPLPWTIGTVVVATLTAVAAFLAYTKVWEWRQEKVPVNHATILSITPYADLDGEYHWSLDGNRIYVEGNQAPIDFPSKYWDDSVKVGDEVDLLIRKSYFNNEYDGLKVEPAITSNGLETADEPHASDASQ